MTIILNLNCVQIVPAKEEVGANYTIGDNTQLISLTSKPLKEEAMVNFKLYLRMKRR